ncbi:sulfatase family protein [Acrocarpospora catenulata]|uniref:sulfatase family protein n=1 Tax=Acrocarpospora catenulata TaxID=2836182 RepID=UPI001BDA5D0A|nr:sulfatase [Acrocarpospora catenulata]
MGKWTVWGAVVALLTVSAPAGSAATATAREAAAAARSAHPTWSGQGARAATEKPNIIFILTDDLDAADIAKFPNISKLLTAQGTTFSRFFVTNPWCCPSRSSILRSQSVHNHQVSSNRFPSGGFPKFHPMEGSTVGTWMRQAGYRTALLGKYLNEYPAGKATYIPPGWDEWAVPVTALYQEYGYRLNANGGIAPHGFAPEDYLADVLTRKAVDFAAKDGPFFLYLSPVAPHRPAHYAPRHENAFADAKAPRTPSFNQEDVSAEPEWIRRRKPLSNKVIKEIDRHYRDRLRAMLGVDDMVGTLVSELTRTGKLSNTYIFFTSDNGFHLGHHRLRPGKTTPFEEDIRVPMIVRGPGVPAGHTVRELGSSVDFAATFADLAGGRLPEFCEGRSLVPLLFGDAVPWRNAALVEFVQPDYAPGTPPTYNVLRTDRYSYVEYATGERQLYDLSADPYQLRNLAAVAEPELIRRLSEWLGRLRTCQGATCRTASVAPPSGTLAELSTIRPVNAGWSQNPVPMAPLMPATPDLWRRKS